MEQSMNESVPDLVARVAAVSPDRPAVRDGQGRVSYRELVEGAARWEAALRRRGVMPGDTVAVCLPRATVTLQAILGIWRIGAVLVPLDPSHPIVRWEFVLADCRARAIVCTEDLAPSLRKACGGTPERGRTDIVTAENLGVDRLSPESSPAPPMAPVDPDSPAYVLYTSGSTGAPKGVRVRHGALAHYVSCAGRLYEGASGPAPWHSPLAFDATVTSLWVPLTHGGEVWPVPGSDPLSGLEGLAKLLTAPVDIGILKITPTHLEALANWLGPEGTPTAITSLVIGGEALRADQVRPWLARSTQIVNEYGPTESTVGVVVAFVAPEHVADGVIPIGRPLPGTEILLCDRNGAVPGPGEPGELCVAGPQLADGYLNRPELTEERFPPHPVRLGERIYRTGDLAVRGRDGELHYVGRIDEQIKFRGQRIEPGEVETVLCGHPGIAQAAVVIHGDRLVAYVVPREGDTALEVQQLTDHLADLLPPALVPQRFLTVRELPVTPNGKLDRSALRGNKP
ncbi:amino acid adenylation domain-containing protein [Streptomyces sp. NPDC048290]|uniref:amino acid adenylation domain-containing protein n=1 Tax=Streptomyces sp. NPDC048290 TaxID=3155811 RepID=UPI00341DC5B4